YSMRAIAEIFHSQGFYVLVPRLPGHGTTPSALRHATWQDWMAVLKMSVRHVRDAVGDDRPFYLGGYSNGGALVVKYTLESFVDSGLARPDRLFLFSPAIGITRFAALASWHKLFSRIPYFRKFEWASIRPEYDPFKYNSFPKIAGHQTFTLGRAIQKQMDGLAGQLTEWPPTLTFQSLVDSTVLTRSVVEQFYDKLPAPKNELVLYDVNRINRMQGFSPQTKAEKGLAEILSRRASHSSPYTLTVITNRRNDTLKAVARTWRGTVKEPVVKPLRGRWPRDVYSLSHVAIPFPPDDPYYGDGRQASSTGIPPLGSLRPRGERNTLTVPLQQLMRLRHNPFFDDMAKRIVEF
ncbi:MAG: alpha/beta fold hydrolase, partial [Gammaproteobacteria bacterium]|nr:alpha/beta fold hydrolase [Gammaproteobacteria bacterium]